MKIVRTVALASLLMFTSVFTFSAQADIVNGSFENGLTGWNSNDPDLVLISFILVTNDTTFTYEGDPINATEGTNYLFLTSGFPETSISQTVTFAGPGKLEFDVATAIYEEDPGDNDDFFRITLDDAVIYEQSVASLGLKGSDFAHVIFDITSGGAKDLKIAAFTGGDQYGFPLYGAVDNITFAPTSVPLPGGAPLLLTAVLVFAFSRRKSKRA